MDPEATLCLVVVFSANTTCESMFFAVLESVCPLGVVWFCGVQGVRGCVCCVCVCGVGVHGLFCCLPQHNTVVSSDESLLNDNACVLR